MRPSPLLLLVLAVAGCEASDNRVVSPTVSDSAGVTLITHIGVVEAVEPGRVSEVQLGGTPEDEPFYRVAGGVLLGANRIAVANAGSQQLLFFNEEGRREGQFGGEGQGPEEFGNLYWIQGLAAGDLVASDPGNGRLTWLAPTGTLISSRLVNFAPESASPERSIVGRGFVLGVTPSRQVVAVPWARADFAGSEGPLPLRGELRRYGSELDSFQALDSVRLRLWFEQAQSEGPPITQIYRSPQLLFSANGEWLAYSEAQTYQITVLRSGAVDIVIREQRALVPFAPDSIPNGYHHAVDSLPAYTALVVDSEGRVWARSSSPDSETTAEWRVFANRGAQRRALRLPATTTVLDARGERVLLLERDDLDVERVVVAHLSRGAF